MDCRCPEAPPPPQAHAVRWPHAARRRQAHHPPRHHHLRRLARQPIPIGANRTMDQAGPAMSQSPRPAWADLIDLAAAENGGLVIDASNMHFGSRHNMIMPGRARNMGDGWETRRRRALTWADGRPVEHDWAIIKLGKRAAIVSIDVDTNHFKGNF